MKSSLSLDGVTLGVTVVGVLGGMLGSVISQDDLGAEPYAESIAETLGETTGVADPLFDAGFETASDAWAEDDLRAPMVVGEAVTDQRDGPLMLDSYQLHDFTAGLRTNLSYSDNLFGGRPGTEISGFYGKISAVLQYAYGDYRGREENFAALTWEPGLSYLSEDLGGGKSAFDHRAMVEARYTTGRFFAEIGASQDRSRDVYLPTGTRTERLTTAGDLILGFAITSKVDLAVTGEIDDREYDDNFGDAQFGSLLDSQTYAYGAALLYQASPKIQYRADLYTGELDLEGQESTDYWGLTVGADYQLSEKITIEGTLGLEAWDLVLGNEETYAVAELALRYETALGDWIRLGLSNRTRPSPYIGTAIGETLRLQVEFEKRVSTDLAIGLRGDYQLLSYTSAFPNAEDPVGDEDYIRISPFVRYQFTEKLSAELFYAHSRKDSDDGTFDFEENLIGVSARIEF